MNDDQAYYAARAAHDLACDAHKQEMDELKASHARLVAAARKLDTEVIYDEMDDGSFAATFPKEVYDAFTKALAEVEGA